MKILFRRSRRYLISYQNFVVHIWQIVIQRFQLADLQRARSRVLVRARAGLCKAKGWFSHPRIAVNRAVVEVNRLNFEVVWKSARNRLSWSNEGFCEVDAVSRRRVGLFIWSAPSLFVVLLGRTGSFTGYVEISVYNVQDVLNCIKHEPIIFVLTHLAHKRKSKIDTTISGKGDKPKDESPQRISNESKIHIKIGYKIILLNDLWK